METWQERLARFATFEPYWDGYDADAIPAAAIASATALIETVGVAPDFVAPISGGGVQVEWSGTQEIEVEANDIDATYDYLRIFGPPGTLERFAEGNGVALDAMVAIIKEVIATRRI